MTNTSLPETERGLTDEELRYARGLCDAASPAPWDCASFTRPDGLPIRSPEDVAEACGRSAMESGGSYLFGVTVSGTDTVVCYTGNGPNSLNNAAFAAEARAVLPSLLDEVERLRAENAELRSFKFVVQETPKQWSTAMAPTMEAVAESVRQVRTQAENEKLRKRVAELEAAAKGLPDVIVEAVDELMDKRYLETHGLITRDALRYRAVGILGKHLMGDQR
jgi:hypothetical protein